MYICTCFVISINQLDRIIPNNKSNSIFLLTMDSKIVLPDKYVLIDDYRLGQMTVLDIYNVTTTIYRSLDDDTTLVYDTPRRVMDSRPCQGQLYLLMMYFYR